MTLTIKSLKHNKNFKTGAFTIMLVAENDTSHSNI